MKIVILAIVGLIAWLLLSGMLEIKQADAALWAEPEYKLVGDSLFESNSFLSIPAADGLVETRKAWMFVGIVTFSDERIIRQEIIGQTYEWR